MRTLLAGPLLLLILLAAPARAQLAADRPVAPDTLTVGAYNLQNVFDVWDNPYTKDETTKVKSRDDVRHLARAIKALDADVLVVQELEHEQLLTALVEEFLPDAGYDYIAAVPGNDPRGILLGCLSRYPITQITSHRLQWFTHPDAPDEPHRFARDLLRFTLDVGLDRPLHVYNVHLKSNRSRTGDTHSKRKRTAEAMRIKQILRDQVAADPGVLAMVAGDFNSAYETRPAQDRPWPAMAHLRQPEADGSILLTDVHDALTDAQRVTHPGGDRYPPVTFDYLLTAPAMTQRYVPDSAAVLPQGPLTSGSDHLPIRATFRIKE